MKFKSLAIIIITMIIFSACSSGKKNEAEIKNSQIEELENKIYQLEKTIEKNNKEENKKLETIEEENEKLEIIEEENEQLEIIEEENEKLEIIEEPENNEVSEEINNEVSEEIIEEENYSTDYSEKGRVNQEYGEQLSNPNLTQAERRAIINEKKNYNKSFRGK